MRPFAMFFLLVAIAARSHGLVVRDTRFQSREPQNEVTLDSRAEGLELRHATNLSINGQSEEQHPGSTDIWVLPPADSAPERRRESGEEHKDRSVSHTILDPVVGHPP
ncbi:hypothetical protein DFH07DRAFT_934946 [Mycena maculata]|uniref:Uncharacterized protein n=1 Tax=Mycena maculata TaxID=230809 RepID=A0AAD7KI02_9AGAR|nr:hypothetical protein DFH07DRAFT_934946 [Mycena maculata]